MSAESTSAARPRLTYVVNHAAFFVSHRLPLALAARQRGYDVDLVTGQAGSESMEPAAVAELARHGIPHTRVAFTSGGIAPITELRGLWQLASHLRRSRPTLIHCASPKGILYGGIAARLAGVHAAVFAVSGMGFAFTQSADGGTARRMIATIYRLLARFAYGVRSKRVIVQNHDDWRLVADARLAKSTELVLVPGSGVDLTRYDPDHLRENVVLFPARILVDKGAREFIAAARALRARLPSWHFVMAGAADYDNPSSVPRAELEALSATGIIEWLGHVADMAPHFETARIVCLPSYREGMPKALLEAAAAGCAVVTTDTTGCREAILPGVTGDLVPPRQAENLIATLLSLIEDPERCGSYGRAGRKLAAERFSLDKVVATIVDLYEVVRKDG